MKHKKKILVVFTGPMHLGGIERSLLGLFEFIDYKNYDVDFFLFGHHGALFKYINPQVNIMPEVKELAYLWESCVDKILHGAVHSAVCRVWERARSKFVAVDHDAIWSTFIDKHAPHLNTQYDLAIGFFRPFDFISSKVDARVKIGWVHTDYSYGKIDREALLKDYSRLDYIAAVSDDCARTFCEVVPELKDKVIVIENVLPVKLIRSQAQEPIPERELFAGSSVKLLSIGRFGPAKNFDNVPAICRLLREEGLNVKWYIIGYGGGESLIRERIKSEGMDEHVIVLGKKANPYPYIAACDIYVQPSRFEGKSVAVREAQLLCKPVVITDYKTANSQLEDGFDGIIVPLENEECAKGLAGVIRDKDLQQKLIENMRCKDYANAKGLKKLCEII